MFDGFEYVGFGRFQSIVFAFNGLVFLLKLFLMLCLFVDLGLCVLVGVFEFGNFIELILVIVAVIVGSVPPPGSFDVG